MQGPLNIRVHDYCYASVYNNELEFGSVVMQSFPATIGGAAFDAFRRHRECQTSVLLRDFCTCCVIRLCFRLIMALMI